VDHLTFKMNECSKKITLKVNITEGEIYLILLDAEEWIYYNASLSSPTIVELEQFHPEEIILEIEMMRSPESGIIYYSIQLEREPGCIPGLFT
jgi:hypothetical protein